MIPLIDVNWFRETSSINYSLVNGPSFNIWFAFYSTAYNFTKFILKVSDCDEKQRTLIRLHYHTTRMAGRRDWACKHSGWARTGNHRLTEARQSFQYFDILWECRWIESSISLKSISGEWLYVIEIRQILECSLYTQLGSNLQEYNTVWSYICLPN
jgi:hypothetical protein